MSESHNEDHQYLNDYIGFMKSKHHGKTLTCLKCLHDYTVETAKWKYNTTLKKKLMECPNCGSGVLLHKPNKI